MDDKVKELYDMCRDNDFSITHANELLDEIDVNEPIHDDPYWEKHITTFLSESCKYTNLKMARLLLEHGADPNYILYFDRPG